MRQKLGGVRVVVDGALVESETLAAGIAGDIHVLSTTVANLGITVHSTYVGHEGLETVGVHLELVPSGPAQRVERYSRAELPVTHARDRCLLDHLARVRDVVERVAELPASLDVGDEALAGARG